jgi:hypothetical protein
MGEARAIASTALSVAIGCSIFALAGVPAPSRAAPLPALTFSDVEAPDGASNSHYDGWWQCAPKARIISGGGFHPDSCR